MEHGKWECRSYHLQHHENLVTGQCGYAKIVAAPQQYHPPHHDLWLFSRNMQARPAKKYMFYAITVKN